MIIREIILFLIKIATMITSVLPAHTPIQFPDVGPLFAVFRGLTAMGRFVDLRVFFVVFGFIMMFELAMLIYAAYRAILGLIPALK